ncbi:GNAT family N-acetyltransferase [Asticcacaulis solisilvae]|uniref:GNAT family N-acetyltransferase n=1 Tax=Asticcacaulis solisilvae TaxID=1217274 RepID=UPI003FD83BE5
MHLIAPTTEHLDALSELAASTFSETFGHLYPPEDLQAFLMKSYAADTVAAEIADPAQFWRLAVDDDGRALAYLQCGPVGLPHDEADPAAHGELKRIYVHSSVQGRGWGKHLLTVAMGWMEDTYPSAPQWIGVWSENLKAQTLYGAYGFERVGEYKFAVGETLDDEFILRRRP